MENKQAKGLRRNIIDKYYTKDDVVQLCLDLVQKHLDIKFGDLIIEPSAGNGSFIEGIKLMTDYYKFYDLEPEHSDIIKQDYLLLKPFYSLEKIHIIGNPPFGRQSSLAIKFIKKSCKFSNSISFILPKSFKKDSLKKSFPLKFHLIAEIDLPDKSFLVNGVEHTVPCIFQIWIKKDSDRIVKKKLIPLDFTFVKHTDSPDIAFRRVGVNAGMIDKKTNKNIQSHYFIKFNDNKRLDDIILRLSTIKFADDNTVGPKSISKQELISKYNQVLM